MKERIKDIIAYLMDPESIEYFDPFYLENELMEMGYSADEIRQAFNMLNLDDDFQDAGVSIELGSKTRVLGESEKLILSTPAQGYLLRLRRLGWISETQLGLIIENASLEFMPPVSVSEIKDLASRYVFNLPEESALDAAGPDGKVH